MRATAPLIRPAPLPPSPAQERRRPPDPRPRPSHRRAFLAGLAASVALHLVAVAVAYRTRLIAPVVQPLDVIAARPVQPQAMRVENILPVPDAVAPPEAERPEPEEPEPVEPAAAAPATDPGAAVADPWAGTTAADWLRPRLGDPRLWVRPDAPPEREVDPVDRAIQRVYAQIDVFNDSVMAEAEADRRATDWTYTDDEGKRWGISPGKVHLGDITLPLPFGFTAPPGKRQEAAERAWKDSEIGRQAADADARENFDDRVRAIREMERRRRQEGAAGSSGGTGSGTGSGTGTGTGSGTGSGGGGG